MELESGSDLVLMGKLLHENSYKRQKLKEVEIDRIKIDFISKSKEIHEIKRSKKIEKAHTFQLLYYLYFLKQTANVDAKGVLDYPLLRRKVKMELTSENEHELKNALHGIEGVIRMKIPPEAEWKAYCRNCSYNELCWG